MEEKSHNFEMQNMKIVAVLKKFFFLGEKGLEQIFNFSQNKMQYFFTKVILVQKHNFKS